MRRFGGGCVGLLGWGAAPPLELCGWFGAPGAVALGSASGCPSGFPVPGALVLPAAGVGVVVAAGGGLPVFGLPLGDGGSPGVGFGFPSLLATAWLSPDSALSGAIPVLFLGNLVCGVTGWGSARCGGVSLEEPSGFPAVDRTSDLTVTRLGSERSGPPAG